MMSNSRYQVLESTESIPAVQVTLSPAPGSNQNMTEINLNENSNNQQSGANLNNNNNNNNTNVNSTNNNNNNNNNNSDISANQNQQPPLSELPSYNEAIRLKKQEANDSSTSPTDLPPSYFPGGPYDPENEHPHATRITIDAIDLRALNEATNPTAYDMDVGSECMFLSAFMIAFFFNWVGFFASICLLPNAAGKYGALSGFGLSMAKWVTIVRYQEWMNNMNDFQQKLFFWLFIFLGFYLFFRGLINYMTLKYRPRAVLDYSTNGNIMNRNRWFGVVE